MNLIIDIGNSTTKLSIFKHEKEVFSERISHLSLQILTALADKWQAIDKCILAASGQVNPAIVSELKNIAPQLLLFSSSTPLPFKNKYATPETLGLDRLAAIAGANALYKKENVLVIDAGTAITFDFINKKEEYLGGNISPGMDIRFKALNHYTEKLPLVKASGSITAIGDSTFSAIENGVVNGIIFEMEGMIETMRRNYTNLTVLLTGGDAHFFDNKLKKTIFVVQNLVSIGLNTILNYNVKIN
ncbi:MAG TPA: type III pantothenate kinase [Bacteroidales bacterium]|jgi:type III pantothenate kinase|nr:type III pantothenate kinase [Bacteroidales bacterium]